MLAIDLPSELPLELHLRILELIDRRDLPTIRAHSLVSKRFVPGCRRLLFHEIDLYSISIYRNTLQSRYQRLCEVVSRNPELATYTKIFHLFLDDFVGGKSEGNLNEIPFDSIQAVQFLGKFANIESFSLSSTVYRRFDDYTLVYPPDVMDAVRDLLRLQGLRHVRLRGCRKLIMPSWIQHSHFDSLHLADWRGVPNVAQQPEGVARCSFSYLAIENQLDDPRVLRSMDWAKVQRLAVCSGRLLVTPSLYINSLKAYIPEMTALTSLQCVYHSEGNLRIQWELDTTIQFPPSLHSLELDMRLVLDVTRLLTPSALAECINTFTSAQSHFRHLTLRVPEEMMIRFKSPQYDSEYALNELKSSLSTFQTVHWSTVFMVRRQATRESDVGSRDKIHMHLDLRDCFAALIEEGRLTLSQEDFEYGATGDGYGDFRIPNDRFGH